MKKLEQSPRMKVRTTLKAGIDTVPLPERPAAIDLSAVTRRGSINAIGTWPTPE